MTSQSHTPLEARCEDSNPGSSPSGLGVPLKKHPAHTTQGAVLIHPGKCTPKMHSVHSRPQ